jgi:hypothetical protein
MEMDGAAAKAMATAWERERGEAGGVGERRRKKLATALWNVFRENKHRRRRLAVLRGAGKIPFKWNV